MVSSLPHVVHVPLAYNDPRGRWKVKARDVMSGQAIEASFVVSEA